ncbi:MAG: PIG-L family deacetylase [Bacillota bacterium]|nr:PIG-L family deacetylase [Bacillota bacterium]
MSSPLRRYSRLQLPRPGHLLAAYPHPDDESFACAGVVALHTGAGYPATLLMGTRGELGRNMGLPPVAHRETLSSIREKEVAEAARIAGYHEVLFLGGHDRLLEFLPRKPLVERILSLLRAKNPALVLTFHPLYGGHADHNAMGSLVTEAVVLWEKEGGNPILLYNAGPNRPKDVDLPLLSVPAAAYIDLKEKALRAHYTQTSSWMKELAADPRQKARWERRFRYERFWVARGPKGWMTSTPPM